MAHEPCSMRLMGSSSSQSTVFTPGHVEAANGFGASRALCPRRLLTAARTLGLGWLRTLDSGWGRSRAACPRSARSNQESADSTESPVPLAATGSPLPSGRAAAARALALSVPTRSLCLVSPGSAGDWLPSRGRTATLSRSPASSATLRAESPSSPRSGKFSEPPWELAAGEMSHH